MIPQFWADVNREKRFLRKKALEVLTFANRSAIIVKQSEANHGRNAGMAELADARDLKSREIFFSYRFDPGFRHHNIAEWSSLVARRAHNPKVMRFKSHLRNQVKPKLIHQNRFRFFTFYPYLQ